MQTVWIVTVAQDYEGEDAIGVFASRYGVEKAVVGYIRANHEYAIGTIPMSLSTINQETGDVRERIRWRIGDLYTITATKHDVKP
ncbi:MAG: hypothetical protein QM323_00465 [Acidobacteriota bacterium]|nr:hypothetical protein [Acidobacteriota bacterium]